MLMDLMLVYDKFYRPLPGIVGTILTLCMQGNFTHSFVPGCLAQSVTYLPTDGILTADPGAASWIPAWSHTFVEIDHEIFSTVILLPSAESFKKGCC